MIIVTNLLFSGEGRLRIGGGMGLGWVEIEETSKKVRVVEEFEFGSIGTKLLEKGKWSKEDLSFLSILQLYVHPNTSILSHLNKKSETFSCFSN